MKYFLLFLKKTAAVSAEAAFLPSGASDDVSHLQFFRSERRRFRPAQRQRHHRAGGAVRRSPRPGLERATGSSLCRPAGTLCAKGGSRDGILPAGSHRGLSALGVYRLRGWRLVLCAGLFCMGFAGLDEWHQSFVPGRSPALRDVFIDTAGSLAGIYATRLVCWIGRRTLFRPLSSETDRQTHAPSFTRSFL